LRVDAGASISQTGSVLVRENREKHRYELINGDEVAGFIVYQVRDGEYWLVHTELEDGYAGSGVGSFLVRKTLDDLRSKGAAVVPTCPFVGGWIKRHPDYQDLVDERTLREFKRSRQAGRRRTARRAPFDPAGPTIGAQCSHVPVDLLLLPDPWPLEGCAECLATGRRDWVHLRVCQNCGRVGCCNDSPGKHGTAHAEQAKHPLIRSYEPGESWWYCYVDVVTFEVSDAPPAPSHG
jgi:predicted GNAT family acetyltransferase